MRPPNVFGWIAIPAGPAHDPKWLAVKDVRFHASAPVGVTSRTVHARLVDQYVNKHLTYMPEPLTEWRVPSEEREEGNCIDYALIKRAILIADEVPSDALYLLVVNDIIKRQQHALLLVDPGGEADFLVLDSFNSLTLPSSQVRDYTPIIAYGDNQEWTYGKQT